MLMKTKDDFADPTMLMKTKEKLELSHDVVEKAHG